MAEKIARLTRKLLGFYDLYELNFVINQNRKFIVFSKSEQLQNSKNSC